MVEENSNFKTNEVELGNVKVPYHELEKSRNITLLDYREIPFYLRGNPYITTGYRSFLSYGKCLRRCFAD